MDDTYTITGGPLRQHEYVIIKREMTAADEAWIKNQTARVTGSKKDPQFQMTLGDVDLALLKRMIVSMHVTRQGENGQQQIIPLGERHEGVEALPRRVFLFVKAVINHFNPEEEEDFAAFLPAAAAGSEMPSTTEKTPRT